MNRNTQKELSQAIRNFTKVIVDILATVSEKSTTNRSVGATPKNSAEQIVKIKELIVQNLTTGAKPMSASELFTVGGTGLTRNQFMYALNAAKLEGMITQVGERRGATYVLPTPKKAVKPRIAKAKAPKLESVAAPA